MTVPVVWIGRQVPCSRITRVVVSKDETAGRRHIVVGVLKPDARGVQLEVFLKVKHRPIGKPRRALYNSCYRRAIFISEGSVRRHEVFQEQRCESSTRSRLPTYFELFEMLKGILQRPT